MISNSMKLSQFAGVTLLLGALAPQTSAQSGAIVPAQAPTLGAAVPSTATPASPSAVRPMAELSFRDAEVTGILTMISENFDVPMVIASDVQGIILPSVNLPNKTPEAAIQAIAMAAGLKYRKQPDGTYLIAKTLPDDPSNPPTTGAITLPGRSPGFGSQFGTGLNPALPGIGSGEDALDSMNSGFPMPQLSGKGERAERKHRHNIRVRNVSASMMAYWIDPEHNAMPVQFQTSNGSQKGYGPQPHAQPMVSPEVQRANRDNIIASFNPDSNPNSAFNPYTQQRTSAQVLSNAQFGGGGGQFGGGGGQFGGGGGGQFGGGGGGNNRGGNNRGGANGGVFQLPEGVDQVVAIDPQNALLVFGTDEGVRELQDTIAFLDRPLRQVEIEAQFIAVSTADSNNFGIDYNTSQGNFNANANGFALTPGAGSSSFAVGFVRNNFQATLRALVAKNRAKLITAPRVTAINNLTASLIQTTSTPFILSTAVQGGGIGGGVAQGQQAFTVDTSIGLIVTPTINNDDTVTVLMQPQLQNQTPTNLGIPATSSQSLQTIANVKDGETIALGGLRTKSITRSGDRIPLLGDLPLIGSLFRNRSAVDTETDLIIFLTARIIRRADDDAITPGT